MRANPERAALFHHKLDEEMEFKKSENIARHQPITPPRIMKAVTQLLVSVSVFYYIFFHASPSRSYFLLHSLKFYLSAIPLHSLDKRWIFLICNGILAIIANTSGLVSFPSGKLDHNDRKISHDHRLHAPAAVDSHRDVFLGEEVQVLLLESAEEAGNGESENYVNNDLQETNEEEDHEEEGDNSSITMEDREEQLEPAVEDQGSEEIIIYITEDDDDDDEEGDQNYSEDGFDPWEEQVEAVAREEEEEGSLMLEKLSAEELNKKFEDFIRKMKEELRIEAQQQQLVVVK